MLSDILIDTLPHTSPLTIKRLKAIDINTFWDLLNYFPFRYEDLTLISTIDKIQTGETVTIKGEILSINQQFTRRGFRIQKAILKDATGEIELLWFNQSFLTNILKPGIWMTAAGPVEKQGNKLNLKPTEYEVLKTPDQETIHTGRIVPVYSQVYGLSSKTIREKMYYIVKHFLRPDEDVEWLPAEIQKNYKLIDEIAAYRDIHFPANKQKAKAAHRRLSFDELFTIQLSTQLVKEAWKKESVSHRLTLDKKKTKEVEAFIKNLPFELTGAQKTTIDEILADITKNTPMNRFVQGDVGSGKTVVAAVASYVAYLNGFQSLIMAPTEILAQQHNATISKMFANYKLKIGLQTGSTKAIDAKKMINEAFDIIIGTQALVTKNLQFDKVGLVVIDEQHRFGVAQRAQLKQKGINPHLLTMTATPIPRTVSLTLYGELDLSIINEMPKGRLPIKTYLTPHVKRPSAYEWIKKQITEHGIQVYIIYPLIEESDKETMNTIRAATKEYEYLKTKVFTKQKVALLHGKMKAKEKDQIMRDFKEKKYDILIATSVVEVGIDVPNATIMIIEGAERFGLAQLHQLRGRVGRGDIQSYCFLFTSSTDNQSSHRLNFFSSTNSGMELAEYDLKVRGPGQIYGTSQSGYDSLKIADFSDLSLIHDTKAAAEHFMKDYSLDTHPKIKSRVEQYQTDQVSRD